jgi:radical SAM superfamily enzyme YgiQ (UPF0313 family)
MAKTLVVLDNAGQTFRHDATRIRFSAHQCLALDNGDADLRCLRLLTDHLATLPGLAVAVTEDHRLLKYILKHFRSLRKHIRCLVVEKVPADGRTELEGTSVVLADEIPADVHTVFLCETRTYPRQRMRTWLPDVRIVDIDVLPDLGLEHLPARAWVPWARDTIYPIELPDIDFQPGMDLIVIDCPARNLGLMPNGLGYVHNALKHVAVKYQTCDLDILLYHRFHMRRLFDEGGKIRLPSGRELPTDPWQAEHYDLWLNTEVISYFEPEIQEIVDKLVAARPKVLGLSIHSCNEKFSANVVERIKAALPEIIIVGGGFSCYSPDIGLRGFPLADYMCIGEADLTVGPLVEQLVRGERPTQTPGVMSRFDPPGTPFLPAPMVHDLDLLEHPRYEWYDLDLYRNYNGYQLTPVIASRGCRWSRCTFCAERFYWRIRSPGAFVDELEWLVGRGCRLFMFNESDLNGRPETLLAICDEIIRRGLQIKLTGQLRIHRKCDRAYFRKLRQAGFVALRFGVDAFSENALRLQKKGYTTATVSQNLKDCWEAGIYTEVNWVIGVPRETDEDIEEGIALILANKPYIGRLANINPLILSTGSVYWLEPEKHNIHFRGDRKELCYHYPRAIPAHLWYSTEPYIDEKVRKQRFERIVLALHEAHFGVGAWAERVIEDVKQQRDAARAGPREEPARKKPSLSAGVGRMEKPPADGELEFNADARSSAYVFRAGSSLPEDKVHYFQSDLVVVSSGDELFGIESQASKPGDFRTIDMRHQVKVRFVQTKAAQPELIQSVGDYNIVLYDRLYYGIPQKFHPAWQPLIDRQRRDHGFLPPTPGFFTRMKQWCRRHIRGLAKRILIFLGLRTSATPTIPMPANPIPWGEADIGKLPGVITDTNLARIIARLEESGGSPQWKAEPTSEVTCGYEQAGAAPPRLVNSFEGYNIVEYEGWFYGMPQTLGNIHLEKVDVLEMPGVIRDLSQEVVENEIREMVS